MPIHTQVWTVGSQPLVLKVARLISEQLLENMIVAAPALLSEEGLLIGISSRSIKAIRSSSSPPSWMPAASVSSATSMSAILASA